jgi:hypothetical protein
MDSGYFERLIERNLVSLQVDTFPRKSLISLFVNHLRQQKCWDLYEHPHRGNLRNGGKIPYRNDVIYFAIGSNGRKYAHLYITPTGMVGTRDELGLVYGRGEHRDMSKQVLEMKTLLFGREESFEAFHKRKKASYGM